MGDGMMLRWSVVLTPLRLPGVRSVYLPLLAADLAGIAALVLGETFAADSFPERLASAALFTGAGRQFTPRVSSVSPRAALEGLGGCGAWVRLPEGRLLLHLGIPRFSDVFVPLLADPQGDAAWVPLAITRLRANLLRSQPISGEKLAGRWVF